MYKATVTHHNGSKTQHDNVISARVGNIRHGKSYVKLLMSDDTITTIQTGSDVALVKCEEK